MMKSFTRIVCTAAASLALVASATAQEWITDHKEALKLAKEQDKQVMINFTGSDWCGWCIRLKEEVFDTPEFKEYASQNLILLEIDSPRKKELPADLQAQNKALLQEFQIRGFPTIVVLNPKGKPVGQGGYQEGGSEAFLKQFPKHTPKKQEASSSVFKNDLKTPGAK